ncbi:hypothetical protein E2C01_085425 [Portunus trituberculatus]|uniref:Uncharacterized protein n=1 Tax=Portunus trituberculatus TaxID=210409 RepID=A0A5B7JAG0_PORTR|nr:hypothetical protein [Portunus trituberculatus]
MTPAVGTPELTSARPLTTHPAHHRRCHHHRHHHYPFTMPSPLSTISCLPPPQPSLKQQHLHHYHHHRCISQGRPSLCFLTIIDDQTRDHSHFSETLPTRKCVADKTLKALDHSEAWENSYCGPDTLVRYGSAGRQTQPVAISLSRMLLPQATLTHACHPCVVIVASPHLHYSYGLKLNNTIPSKTPVLVHVPVMWTVSNEQC